MIIPYNKVLLRDQDEKDIEDEIRWMTKETGWIKADTPWESIMQVNTDELRNQIIENISFIKPDIIRNRLEISVEGKHIGFVSVYPFEVNTNQKSVQYTIEQKAIGIEICEPAFRNQGYGTDALHAWVNYLLEHIHSDIYLETWSGNISMIKCAEKCGFQLYERQVGKHIVDSIPIDVLIYKLNANKTEK